MEPLFLSFRRHPRIKRSEAYIVSNELRNQSFEMDLVRGETSADSGQLRKMVWVLILKLRLWGSVELVCKDYTNDSYYRRYRKYWY